MFKDIDGDLPVYVPEIIREKRKSEGNLNWVKLFMKNKIVYNSLLEFKKKDITEEIAPWMVYTYYG